MRLWIARLLIVVSVAGLAGCDQVTKVAAKEELEGSPPRDVLGQALRLDYTENRDTGFGLLRWVRPPTRLPLILLLQSLGSLALMVVLARRHRLDLGTAAFSLMLGGGLGNLLDRAFRGYVIDFVRVPHWPVFNLADVWIALGLGLFLLALLRARGGSQPVAAG